MSDFNRDLTEHAPDMIWFVDPDGSLAYVNEACEIVTGYTREELLAKDPPCVIALESLEAEIRIVAKSGAVVDLEVKSAPLNQIGSSAGVLAIARDVTARRNFERLFSKLPMPMWVFDAETLQFLEVNQAAVERYDYTHEEFLAMSVAALRPASDLPRLLAYLDQIPPDSHGCAGRWRHLTKAGAIFDAEVIWRSMEFGGRPAILSIIEDITERKLLEEQLQQSHKLEAVGRLAGGIAHDFNNLLTVITGYSQLLLNRIANDHPMHAGLDEIRRSADKASLLTRQLVAFSRRQSLKPSSLDLNEVVSDMEKTLRRLIGAEIELVTQLSPDLVRVRADASQIEQVILNLALNARDAMPHAGTLTLETATVKFPTLESAAGHPPGAYAMVAVTDTGHGMDNEVRDHLFEPFFSTKTGEGSGLGLSAVYGIVQQHGGFILVSSEPGEGSRFQVYLPQAADQVRMSATEAAPSGRETILVVGDESGVLKLIAETLEDYGYTVIEVRNSEEALQMAGQDQHVDLLLTDIEMPIVNGPDLAAAWKKLRPNLKVLCMSGYNFDTLAGQRVSELSIKSPLLRKPFSGLKLARKVREVLDGVTN